jgi:hypothetical protein
MGRFGLMSSCASPRCAGRLQLALGASQIIDDRGDIFRSYRRLVRADHLVDDVLPSLLRQIGLIQNVIGGMAGEAVAVDRVGSWPVREGRITRWDLEIERCQRVELRRMADERSNMTAIVVAIDKRIRRIGGSSSGCNHLGRFDRIAHVARRIPNPELRLRLAAGVRAADHQRLRAP